VTAGTSGGAGDGRSATGGHEDPHVRRVLVIWVTLSVILIVAVFLLGPVIHPRPASDTARFANLTDDLFTALGVTIGLFVWVFAGYSLVAFRERKPAARVEELEDGPPLQAKPVHQIVWLAVTGLVAMFLIAWGMYGFYDQTTVAATDPLVVNVVGQQWTWTFDYPSLGVESHTLELPQGQQVRLRVTSDDVLHGFEITQLGIAMDANPGEWVDVPLFTATRTGSFQARCMELCGLYHTYMWAPVNVVSRSAFASWVAANGGHAGTAAKSGGSSG